MRHHHCDCARLGGFQGVAADSQRILRFETFSNIITARVVLEIQDFALCFLRFALPYTSARRRYQRFAIVLLPCLLGALLPTGSRSRDDSWQRDLADWRAKHAAELQKPDG